MQLTAVHTEWGRLDVTLEDLGCGRSWIEIHRVRGVELTCPECGGQVRARLSKLGTRHFYHRTKPPTCSLANESLEHHLLKLELVTCARAAGFQAELEVAAPTGEWRADVMVFGPDGNRLMALEAQLSPITVEDIAARTGLYERDGIRVCWFGFRPRPWVGSVPTLLVQAPEERGQQWRVAAGLARLSTRPMSWSPVAATLGDAVAWMLTGRIVPHSPLSSARRVTEEGTYFEWAEGWTRSWNDAWRLWWTTPAYSISEAEGAREEAEARRRREAEEKAKAQRRAIEEREKARKKEAKDRAYAAFWNRTGLDRQLWKHFRALAERFFDRSLAFGAPDSRYGEGRPVYERSGPDGEQWTLVGVACPNPRRLGAWAEELALLVPSDYELEALAVRAWAPFQVYALNPYTGRTRQERVLPAPISP
ncbi:competence protein CoiA family protein [Streptomyces sp. NPDC002215]|uniref:competence protein CoiA family protein n=1 Tax=Streptomyces sp. NPDC002215 TaxID=3154412 RepID=UPI00332C7CBC